MNKVSSWINSWINNWRRNKTYQKIESGNSEIPIPKEIIALSELKQKCKGGINPLMEVLNELYKSQHDAKEEETSKVLAFFIKLVTNQLKRLQVEVKISREGENFDEDTMEMFIDDSIKAPQASLVGTVAYSVTPAYYTTIPIVELGESQSGLFLLKPEHVVLYKK